jgi:hypothetical protein
MNNTPVYLSRSFVEFGPFTPAEMKDFFSRGLLRDIDHIRHDGHDDWSSVTHWIAQADTAPKATPKAAPKAKPAATPAAKTPKAKPAAEKPKNPAAKKAKKTP